MKEDIVRVVRVLEYTGPRSHVEKVLAQNAVKGTKVFGDFTIREAILGEFPEIVGTTEEPIGKNAQAWHDFIVHKVHTARPYLYRASSVEEASILCSDMVKLGYPSATIEPDGITVAIK